MRAVLLLLAATLSWAQTPEPLKLTLEQAEKIAIQNNPRVASARYLSEASKEVPKEVHAGQQPQVFGSVTGAAASDGTRIAAGGLNNPVIYDRFASGFGVSQLITDFGRTSNLVASARYQSLAQEESSNATRAGVLLEADRAYFGLLRAQAVRKVARETVAARQLVVDQITALANNRLKSNLDVSFANVNLSEAQLLLSSAENNVKASSAALAAAIGYPNQRDFVVAEEPMPGELPADPGGLIAEALQNRPELGVVRYQEQAAAKSAKAERALMFPAISTIAGIGVVPTGVDALASRYGAVGLNVNVPILNGGLYTARRTEAELRERSARENVKDLQNRVVRDVQVAYLNAVTAYERLGLTAKLLEQAGLALKLARSRYDLGLSSVVELSQAQLNLTSAQIANTTARYDYQTQWRTLQFETGALRP